jgi:hypothetical protein
MRRLIATLFLTAALAVGAVAPTASAAPVVTGGLVNITITDIDILNGSPVTTQVALGAALNLAANVCNVPVAVLATQINTGTATCDSLARDASATITQRSTQ